MKVKNEMKKKKVYFAIIFVSLIIFLTSCAETPSDVVEDINRRQEDISKQVNKNINKELMDIKDVRKETPMEWKSDDGVLKFDGLIKIPQVEQLHIYNVEINNEAYYNADKVKEILLKYFSNLEEKTEYVDLDGTYLDSYNYFDVEDIGEPEGRADGLSISKSSQIGMVMYTEYWKNIKESAKWGITPSNADLEYISNYYIGENGVIIGDETQSYELYGGKELTVQDVLDSLNSIIEDFNQIFSDTQFIADRIGVFKNEVENCYILTGHGAMLFDDVMVDDALLIEQNIKDYGNICRLNSELIQTFMKEDDIPPYWTTLSMCFRPKEKVESYNKIIGFEQAWELLKEKAAVEEIVTIHRADLIYSVYYEPNGDTDNMWWYQMEEPPVMKATPVWRFVSYINAQASFVYYVDALTGEVTAYNHAPLQ